MSIIEKDVLLQKNGGGNNEILYPVTKTNNILDMEEYMTGYRNLKIYTGIFSVFPQEQFTENTTLYDIAEKLQDRSLLLFSFDNTIYTNEIVNMLGNKYALVEIIRYNNASIQITVYDRHNSSGLCGYYHAKCRITDNYMSDFIFIGKSNWTDLEPLNGWTNYSSTNTETGHPFISWRKENNGIRLRGLAKYPSGSGANKSIITNLPAQARPKCHKLFTCVTRYRQNSVSVDTITRIDINPNGNIMYMPYQASTADFTTEVDWVSFDNIFYPLD
ncbi:hypothetical protein [uncultured Clostridium sp.]|uniref:hypothetical protein n=1 Tax=uncultured Clostridium sp. TaxID=59620 RepID=UPI0026F0DF59|nr:hypothetical protein [uncultured Clostridium sp.]